MARSTRGTVSLLVVIALVAGVSAPALSASASPERAAVVDWSQVPGATPDDLIVNPYSNYQGAFLGPGFSYTGRANGIADFCAATDTTGAYPCPFSDFHDYFTLNSATANGLGATINITVTNSHSTSGYLAFTSSARDSWQQVFSASSHGWLNFAELIGGQQVGQSAINQVVCQTGVPCTVSFSMTDDYGKFIGNKWLATSLDVASQIFIPLTVATPPATPPTSAFSAVLSGATAHDWAFDGSASTAVIPNTVASYRWTFGDGATETTTTPTTHHSYADGSTHTASLVVVDSAGTLSVSVSHDLAEPKLIVNSAGDAPAIDPSRGCNTGDTVGTPPAPECTLRAAIQSLDAGVGGTKIAFSLPSGSTTITAASALPEITKPGATIDGTNSTGMPTISGSSLHVLNASGVTITQVSVVASGDFGVFFDRSPGATLTSSLIGASPNGTVGAAKFGVVMNSSGVVTVGGLGAGNVIEGTVNGLLISPDAAMSALTVQGNSIGELADGTLVPGGGSIGLTLFAGGDTPVTGATIADNQIAGFDTNVSVAGSGVLAPRITGNRIGVAADQTSLLGTPHTNLRLDGVPGAVVSANQLAGASGFDLLVSGSVQVSIQPVPGDPDLRQILYRFPGGVGVEAPLSNPIVGTHDTISGNRIGAASRISRATADGIALWNLADDTTVSGNTVLDHDSREIDVVGAGARLSITGNVAGAGPGQSVGYGNGITVQGMPSPMVTQNTVGGVFMGIELHSDVVGAKVSGNTIGFTTDGQTAAPVNLGIDAEGSAATIGPDNTVGNATRAGIYLNGAGAQVISNRIGAARFGSSAAPNDVGILVETPAVGAIVGGAGAGNTIVGNPIGLQLASTSADVGGNVFGVITSGALGNGTAIDDLGSALIHDNKIANSSVVGVRVATGVVTTMQHNSIYGTAGGIGVTGATVSPVIVEADRVTHGASTRTFLVLRDVPTTTGTIEVFGNASCADPEARYPLFTTPTTSSSQRVISVADRTDMAGLTIMVTTNGSTSLISNCRPSGPGEDSDGDGIPDLVEFLYPGGGLPAASANAAAFVADNQQWVQILSGPGTTLSNVSPVDDPNPSGHPGALFPLGLIDWTLSGIEPGSLGAVVFTLPGTVINGWWKYSANRDPQFYDYGYSSIAGYGAKVTAANVPGSGLSTVVAVLVPDGGVGDDDGLENGSIHDPAAPAVVPQAPGTVPTFPIAETRSGFPAVISSAPLASTGSNPSPGIGGAGFAIALGLLLLGTAALRARQRRRR